MVENLWTPAFTGVTTSWTFPTFCETIMDEMTEVREKLVTACRILEQAGVFDDFGHFSARCGSGDQMLINPALPSARMAPEELLLFDLNGARMARDERTDSDVVLHYALYQKRPDVMAIAHTHSPMAVTLSIAGIKLKAVENMGSLLFPSEVPLYDKYGPVTEMDQAHEVADAMAAGNIIVLRGHGAVVAGTTIEETCMTALYVERCAGFQYRTVLIGGSFPVPEKDREKTQADFPDGDVLKRSWVYFGDSILNSCGGRGTISRGGSLAGRKSNDEAGRSARETFEE